jgi:hypothetical protein
MAENGGLDVNSFRTAMIKLDREHFSSKLTQRKTRS